MMSYSNKYMPYSNEYDAIPICRTHARTEPVRTPKFSSDNACDKIVACRTRARVVASCAFTPLNFIFKERYEYV